MIEFLEMLFTFLKYLFAVFFCFIVIPICDFFDICHGLIYHDFNSPLIIFLFIHFVTVLLYSLIIILKVANKKNSNRSP